MGYCQAWRVDAVSSVGYTESVTPKAGRGLREGGARKKNLLINLLIVIKPRVSLASVETSSKGHRQLTDKSVVGNT